ncbi:unnamed protein product [Echinostoma caproni]|uniref:EKA-like protein n=1 Tax=Echinostoma caproni TaxID=27848 RepID=A0A183BAX8_9TREM|nr:unnamed protein product [Echinostoma caproni]
MNSVSSATGPAEKPKASPLNESTPKSRSVLQRAGPEVKKVRKAKETQVAPKTIAPALETGGVKQRSTKVNKEITTPAREQHLDHKTGPLKTPERSTGSRSWATVVTNTLLHNPVMMNGSSSGTADLDDLVSTVSDLRVTNIGQAKGGLSWVAEDMPTINVIAKNEVAPRVLRPKNLIP